MGLRHEPIRLPEEPSTYEERSVNITGHTTRYWSCRRLPIENEIVCSVCFAAKQLEEQIAASSSLNMEAENVFTAEKQTPRCHKERDALFLQLSVRWNARNLEWLSNTDFLKVFKIYKKNCYNYFSRSLCKTCERTRDSKRQAVKKAEAPLAHPWAKLQRMAVQGIVHRFFCEHNALY